MHGYLGRDGSAPAELLRAGREEVRSYGGEILTARVSTVSRLDDRRFRVELPSGDAVVARRVLAATGLVDELPDIEGLAEHWGHDVIHCPFCHGFEVRDRRIVQIVTHPVGLHTAALFQQLTEHLTVVLHGPEVAEDRALDVELDALRAAGAQVLNGTVRRILSAPDGRLVGVELAGTEPPERSEQLAADVVAVGPRFTVRAEPFLALGLALTPHPSGLGEVVPTDAAGETAVPGLYAAGNVADPSQQVLQAAADGGRVGAMISFSLAADDLAAAARTSANEADWDHRYGDAQIWSGNPNGSLVDEVGDMPPGRALDVGAGEGGDAVWLASRGWTVTANDISQRALDRVGARAEQLGLQVRTVRADANARDAFEPGGYDLVSAQYASIPRTPDRRGVHNLLDAVAPGGSLLVVSHDIDAMRHAAVTPGHGSPFDPDAYVRVEDFVAVLAESPSWTVESYGKRPRPPGAAAASAHHVEDVVLRARRSA